VGGADRGADVGDFRRVADGEHHRRGVGEALEDRGIGIVSGGDEDRVRRDLLAPLTRLRFGPDVPVPFFRRKNKPPTDLSELAGVIDVAVNRLGIRVPLAWARQSLGIPDGEDGDGLVAGARD